MLYVENSKVARKSTELVNEIRVVPGSLINVENQLFLYTSHEPTKNKVQTLFLFVIAAKKNKILRRNFNRRSVFVNWK